MQVMLRRFCHDGESGLHCLNQMIPMSLCLDLGLPDMKVSTLGANPQPTVWLIVLTADNAVGFGGGSVMPRCVGLPDQTHRSGAAFDHRSQCSGSQPDVCEAASASSARRNGGRHHRKLATDESAVPTA